MQSRKRKLTKKRKPILRDISSDLPDVDLSRHLSYSLRYKKYIKVDLKDSQLDKAWADIILPKWQDTWLKKGLKIKYNKKEHSLYCTYSQDLVNAYQNFIKLTR